MCFVGESFSFYNALKNEELCSCLSRGGVIDLLFFHSSASFHEPRVSLPCFLAAIGFGETYFHRMQFYSLSYTIKQAIAEKQLCFVAIFPISLSFIEKLRLKRSSCPIDPFLSLIG